jgi:hypothetical protein
MKRLIITLAVLLAAGCATDRSPTSPPAGDVALVEGPYTLRIAAGPGSTCFNLGSGADSNVQLDVSITVMTGGWRVSLSDAAAGGLVLTLNRQGSQVTGHAFGRAVAGGVSISLDHPLAGGPDSTPNSASGGLTGTISYEGSAGATVCTASTWTLTRRP